MTKPDETCRPDLNTPDSPLVSRLVASPNHGPRMRDQHPTALILHYTGMESAQAAIAWLADPVARVSAHYVIDEHGAITQMVAETRRAWHAGVSFWCGERDINGTSIGIEIHNPGHGAGMPDYPAAQMDAVARLCADILARWGIAPQRVLGHSDVSPGRKIDPGEHFNWGWLAARGVGHWVEPTPLAGDDGFGPGDSGAEIVAFAGKLRAYGYDAGTGEVFDAHLEEIAAAFQRHFRPARVDGRADASTLETLERLSAALR